MNTTVYRAWAFIFLLVTCGVAWYLYSVQTNPEVERKFRFGLDLVGGSHLVYEADTRAITGSSTESTLAQTRTVDDAMNALREVIARRVDLYGVSEPLVQVEKASVLSESERTERLIVELPGVTDLQEAIALIGATPQLEFKLVGEPVGTSTEPVYIETGLTGKYLERATPLPPNNASGMGFSTDYTVSAQFNAKGKELFADITRENVGRQLAIFLDGELKSDPVIREAIVGGTASISGGFTPEEARELARNLNIGALPVPIHLVSTESVGASLGMETLQKGVVAGMWGIGIVMLFLMVWYRLPGFIASLALLFYIVINLGVYMFIPVTITAAGLAGFILSSGMAVDANILIFERTKDELRRGKSVREAVREGVARAWLPIRDGNFTGILAAFVLYWFGTAGVQGFALTLTIGILVSMFTAIVVTRTSLLAVADFSNKVWYRKWFLSGIDRHE